MNDLPYPPLPYPSACDTCKAPGSCCRDFAISSHSFPIESWEADAANFLKDMQVPFFRVIKAVKCDYNNRVKVACDCTLLDENGRCSDYENRPVICRIYRPKSDALCCEYEGERPPPVREESWLYPKSIPSDKT